MTQEASKQQAFRYESPGSCFGSIQNVPHFWHKYIVMTLRRKDVMP